MSSALQELLLAFPYYVGSDATTSEGRSFSPESNRNRFLHVHYMSISHKDWGDGTSNGPMSVRTAREVYKSLKTPEAVTIYCSMPVSTPVSLPAMPAIGADVRETDDTFLKCSIFVL